MIDIDLSSNELTGKIPTGFGGLTTIVNTTTTSTVINNNHDPRSLQRIILSENDLTGTLPTEFGLLAKSLKELELGNNRLSGTLPMEWSALIVSSNSTTVIEAEQGGGVVAGQSNSSSSSSSSLLYPPCSGGCLEVLDLSKNILLEGTVPLEWSTVTTSSSTTKRTKLRDVMLHGTRLTGSLDGIFCTTGSQDVNDNHNINASSSSFVSPSITSFDVLSANCQPDDSSTPPVPMIECSCCTLCCESATDICHQV